MTEENYFDKIAREGFVPPEPRKQPDLLSDTLREAILEDGRTIYEIAKAIGIEPDSLYRFQGGKDIRLDTADRLAKALGLELRPFKRKRRKTTQ
jgi:Predicted transcriptional regulator with an HTH domain